MQIRIFICPIEDELLTGLRTDLFRLVNTY